MRPTPASLLLVAPLFVLPTPAQREPPAWRAEREVVVAAGDPGVSLAGRTRIAVSPRGMIAATQPLDGWIQLYTKSGKPIAMVPGLVPGPFDVRRASRIGFRAESVWIADGAMKRFTIYGPELGKARLRSAPPAGVHDSRIGGQSGVTMAEALLATGGVLLASREFGRGERAIGETHLYVIGAAAESLVALPPLRTSPDASGIDRFDVSSNGGFIAVVQHRREGSGKSVIIRLFDADGIERYRRAVPLTPRTPPAVHQIIVGNDGTVWLRLTPRYEAERWLVLDPGGARRATVSLPARPDREVQDVGRDRLWATELTPEGATLIVAYRLLATS
jgi:hypothetical protein